MITTENKNLIITYLIALLVGGVLVFIIINFNNWFFPNADLTINKFTPTSRGTLSQESLRFGILSDKKFTSLEPIVLPSQIVEELITDSASPSVTIKPTTNKMELRHGNPFEPF